MPYLEEITYDLGRAELADQESLVSGIRARTGTLVATQALVASFLGGAAADRGSFGVLGWSAIAMLVVGLGLAAVVLAPWRMRFALDSREIYEDLNEAARRGDLDWLAAISFAHGYLCDKNYKSINYLSLLSILMSCVTVVQAFLWIGEIAA